jgi:hypothetical protein
MLELIEGQLRGSISLGDLFSARIETDEPLRTVLTGIQQKIVNASSGRARRC